VPIASYCRQRRIIALFALLIIASGCRFQSSSASDDSSWQPVLFDIHDHKHMPFEDAACPAFVMIFIMHDCPISNSYVPELNRWHEWLDARHVPLLIVHADPNATLAQAKQHAAEYKISWPVVLDRKHTWVERAGATRVPEAVVFSREQSILYRGRIDNQYAGLGKRRAVTTSHDLRDALENVVSGGVVAQPRTEAVGCYIPRRDPIASKSAGAEKHANP
jgi:hypothetical protein